MNCLGFVATGMVVQDIGQVLWLQARWNRMSNRFYVYRLGAAGCLTGFVVTGKMELDV